MQRIATLNRAIDLFGVGKDGFRDGDKILGVDATELSAAYFNAVQEELAAVIEAAGIALNAGSNAQLLAALRILASNSGFAQMRNLAGSSAGAVKTASWNAGVIVAETALGDVTYKGKSLALAFNGGNVGANGMDSGATPVSADLYVYAIHNPTTNNWATLGTTVGNGAAVHSGANMPAGYTASCLLWAGVTNGSGQLPAFAQIDRVVALAPTSVLATSTTYPAGTSVAISGVVPKPAKNISGSLIAASTTSSTLNLLVSGNPQRLGEQGITSITTSIGCAYARLPLPASQTINIITNSTAGTASFQVFVSAYEL